AVTDLEPFLGAAGHMLLVNAVLTEALHVHPEEQSGASSTVTFLPLLPAAGVYKLWVQFQRRGRILTVPFVIGVADRGERQSKYVPSGFQDAGHARTGLARMSG